MPDGASGPIKWWARRCITIASTKIAIATTTPRRLRPPVISASQSRQESISSWRANQTRVAGELTPRLPALQPASGRCPPGSCRWRPALIRSSSRVPSAISRPAAITPIRSAIRSATSRMWVVMRTVPPDLYPSEQDVLHLPGRARVEPGQRLVEDDEAGVVHERARQRDLLLHAAREAFAALVRMRPEAEPVDQLLGSGLRPVRRRCPRVPRRIRDIRTA